MRGQTTHYRKLNFDSRKQHDQQRPKSATQKLLRTYAGTTKTDLTKELQVLTFLVVNQFIKNILNLFMEIAIQDEIPVHTSNLTIEVKIGGVKQTVDLLLLTVTTMNTILVIL